MKELNRSEVKRFESIISQIIDENYKVDSKSDYYARTYESYINFYKSNRPNFNHEVFHQGLNMVYGWMPTIPKRSKPITKDDELNLFSAIFQTKRDDFEKICLDDMKQFTNNSIVGLSKMLHFMNPNVFPIWDSNIAGVFEIKWHSKVNSSNQYRIYTKAMHNVAKDKMKLRTIEVQLFQYGQELKLRDRLGKDKKTI